MLEPFTIAGLEAVLELKPVSAAGRAFIDKALKAPSRNVQGTTKNVVTDLPCPKMRGNAQAESWSVETPFILQYIFDDEIIGYINQTPRVEIFYRGRNGRNVRAPYTGDTIYFHKKKGVVVEEWKPATDRGVLEEMYPGKYERSADGSYSSPAIKAVFEPMGISFGIRFSDEVSSIGHRNRKLLYPYLQPSAEAIYVQHLPGLISFFADKSSATYAELLETGVNIDVLNWAIAHKHLHVDLDDALLASQTHLVRVFRHAVTLQAWQLAIRPDGTRPSAPTTLDDLELGVGDAFIFDGQRLKVSLSGATAIYAVDANGVHITISHEILLSAHRAGKVTLPERLCTNERTGRFWRVSPAALERAIRRLEILEMVDAGKQVPLSDRVAPSTLRRWNRLIREGLAKGLSPLESVADENDLRGFRGSHIDESFSTKLNVWILDAIRGKLAKSTRTVFFDIKELAEAEGHRMIAKSSFYERVIKLRTVEDVQESLGHKVAYPLPDAIIHDWGSEFKAKDFKYALTSLFIQRHVRPKSAGRFGSVLERTFGVTTRELIDNLAGNTKLRKNVRQLSPQSDPTTHSGLWLADIYQGLEDYFFNIYDNRKHSTTLRPPKAMFEASFITHGVRPHRLRRFEELMTILMPTAKGRPRVIDPARGVHVNYRYYGHPQLANLALTGTEVIVKPLPFDPGSVLVFMKTEWIVCRTGLHEDIREAPEFVRRCLFEEWSLEQRLVEASHDNAREKLRDLLERMNSRALQNKEYFRDRAARDLMSPAVFSANDIEQSAAGSLRKLIAMMKTAVDSALKSTTVGHLVDEK